MMTRIGLADAGESRHYNAGVPDLSYVRMMWCSKQSSCKHTNHKPRSDGQ